MKLVIFDVDGTLSDSQGHIGHAMTLAFESVGLAAPAQADVLSIVGLSLPQAVARLAPDLPTDMQARIVEGYKASYFTHRAAQPAPLFAGALECLRALSVRDDLLLGIATGKSRRGLRALLEFHGLEGMFVTTQVADDHPSKPHPAMIEACLSDTGIAAADAMMIGDTTYDIDMANAAHVAGIGVAWGYHPVADLQASGAKRIVADFAELTRVIETYWEVCA